MYAPVADYAVFEFAVHSGLGWSDVISKYVIIVLHCITSPHIPPNVHTHYVSTVNT